ncbi:hypothetical protein [Henriciella aquimarina]|uniref:hypothetical protein n=1 Tax=Henriciella aquimarina TaxID=545261 RepID=UPI00117B0033|nr:hypothetical protein [Henriciella aquimarina]
MTAFDWSMMTASGLMCLAALALLFLSWKRPGNVKALTGGWALLAGALVLAFFANGDRGVAQASVIAMAGATAFFAMPVLKGLAPPVAGARRRTRNEAEAPAGHPLRTGLLGVWTFLVAAPVAGVIAFLAAAGLFKLIRPAEGSAATAGTIAIIAAVLIWALVSVLLLIEPRAGRRSIYAGVALAATAAMAFI